ncbi:MAG: hypothetical protein A3K18_30930 [Lentisphaerae bacterium RIFOXYA12_64_32]|nr:MAG: hypothetical protein A3K18_30930 [Lentisphaerae bacterium RIFOXYA12_64_32]
MCEFCVKHGEGRTWYLDARNYSSDLVRNSRKFRDLLNWLTSIGDTPSKRIAQLRHVTRVPALGLLVRWLITRRLKVEHFGQVLPLEDVKAVFEMVDVIRCVPCVCRQQLLGTSAERYCFALGSFLEELLDDTPARKGEGETLTAAEAFDRARQFGERGLVHTIWTLETPFIVGICSCRPGECLGLELTQKLKTKVMFRSEYLAWVDPGRCAGRLCPAKLFARRRISDRGLGPGRPRALCCGPGGPAPRRLDVHTRISTP